MIQSSPSPVRLLEKTKRRPSGDHVGQLSSPSVSSRRDEGEDGRERGDHSCMGAACA